ncbi:UDP-N-acetylmuramoyl-tripeptide--D-alanyl-D-alanine ligase [Candidatus Formimonas warabiya]|uniref:UDP-N-acetylmuramoyl-tripeptide--D-alanyl-D-alanine ligase n=1 Tax=Formimonas warabiya TaxID=1761012 RepID=A0A3G1KMF5_FORW1|nr:UDP-N-acetylmuramoyl-tripeptide--D-alanyl-D-alanine ligase [Candidatus Formimonas warabiya]ATW23633.1 hypothetical protein DCMF_01395 [Candidatus Formimonas warabiya]
MESIYLDEIIQATGGKYAGTTKNILIHDVSTDSRKVKPGDLFIALEGEFFDGHDFIKDAVHKGAQAVLASKPVTVKQVPVILVADTSKALLDLAAFYRQKFPIPVIAVTGSVGKTSTKDMIASILSAKLNVHKSKGNYNNNIGLPLTIFQLEAKHDAMVVEMGMRGLGEISELTRIAKPSLAVITNIGVSHLERLGTQENILKAKLEILAGLEDNGVLILNANDPLLCKVDPNVAKNIVYVGVNTPAHYTAYDVRNRGEEGISFKLNLGGQEYDIQIPAVGEHNVSNALFGIACARRLGLSPEQIISGIKNYTPEKMRCTLIEKNGITFLNDCYNASPDSFKAALEILHHLASGKRALAIIGNIFELGEIASAAHFEVGRLCSKFQVAFTAIIGANAPDVARGIGDPSKYKIFDSHEEVVRYMKEFAKEGDVVLIKGSRGMKLEKILDLWEA